MKLKNSVALTVLGVSGFVLSIVNIRFKLRKKKKRKKERKKGKRKKILFVPCTVAAFERFRAKSLIMILFSSYAIWC